MGDWQTSVKLADVSIDPATGKVAAKEEHDHEHKAFTASSLADATIKPGEALTLAMKELGGAPLEKIEIKTEHGSLVLKAMTHDHDEAIVPLMIRIAV